MPDIDLDRFRLRRFVEELEAAGEVERHDEPLDLADLPRFIEHNPKAVLCTAVGPERQELVANVTASRKRLALAFGVAEDKLLAEVQRRLRSPAKIIELTRAQAPVQQVVLTGEEADLTTLPVHLQHGCDGAPYISASLDFIVDPRSGQTNSGIRRMMLRGPKEAGIDLVSPSDFRAIYEANVANGPFPVAFVIGAHPIDYVSAMMRVPVDELHLVASLRDAPLPVVKCLTSEIRVPADAEWVLEGHLDPRGHVEEEGPFGEFLGYYGAVKRNPVFHLTAITRRRDALFQSMSIGGSAMSLTDTAQLNGIRSEVMVWRALETAVREPVRVYATPASGGMFNLRIALRQRVPGEGRNAIAAAFGSLGNVKNVFVFDPDIDIFSDEQVDWALATRFQADRDLVVLGGMRALPLDPSLQNHARIGGKAGFDCTVPFGQGDRLDFSVPAPPVFTASRPATVEAALAEGPKFFVELMAATQSRDGREIVRELERLSLTAKVERDREGRWLLGSS